MCAHWTLGKAVATVRLTSITVQMFRNFVAPQMIAIEDDVTILVGKNESGKTTILKALHRLNPANLDDDKFDLTIEYPRWRLARDRKNNPSLQSTTPIEARFTLDEVDCAAIAELVPVAPPVGAVCNASRTYENTATIRLTANLGDVVRAAAATTDVTGDDLTQLLAQGSLDDVVTHAKEQAKDLKAVETTALRAKAFTNFGAAVAKYQYLFGGVDIGQEARDAVWGRMPKFFYFANYQNLPGEADLNDLAEKIGAGTALTPQEKTVVALLAHAAEEASDFLDEHYDSRKAELQAASLDLSRQAFKYWRQNEDLAVVFDTDNVSVGTLPQGGPIMHRFLKIELRDGRHGDVETNFETRSSGFRWFFSFFAAFSEYQESDEPLVVLLDEPGTSLHGDAQRDFVRFISEELASSKQTIYTTHSQHMVDPTKYEKLRAVHDRATREEPDLAVVVTPVDLSADRDTILPVESALGYSVAQHLFLGSGPHLAVEGSSDFIYLQRLTEHLRVKDADAGLDPRLAIIPVGGADNMPAFVALMGRRLSISVLVDGARTGKKLSRIRAAAEANGVPLTSIVVCADADDGLPKTADIEDLFEVEDYLKLYNWSFNASVAAKDLAATDEPILRRLEGLVGEFDHALPAHALTEHRKEFFADIQQPTIARFEKLFVLLNATVIS